MAKDETGCGKNRSITMGALARVRVAGQGLAFAMFVLVLLPVVFALAFAVSAFETEEIHE
jgi:hypothetical protein